MQTVLFKEVCQCNRLSACREPVPGGVFVQRRGRGTLGLVQLSLEGREGRGWNVARAVPRVGRLWVWPVSPSGHSEVGCRGEGQLGSTWIPAKALTQSRSWVSEVFLCCCCQATRPRPCLPRFLVHGQRWHCRWEMPDLMSQQVTHKL